MFVATIKGNHLKTAAVLMLSVAALTLFAVLLPKAGQNTVSEETYRVGVNAAEEKGKEYFRHIKTNDDRVAFLKGYGWEVNEEAVEIVEVTVPGEFDATYEAYNEIQKAEGLDLEKVKGKNVKRYTYTVENYDAEGTVYANVIVYKNEVVGGDICSADVNGFLHGFTKENAFLG